MLSGKLICLIEMHEQEIAGRVVRAIHQDTELVHLARLPDAELRERAREILQNLGHWLVHRNEEDLARVYENIAQARFAQSIPLSESMRGLCLLKNKMIDYVDEQSVELDTLALYAEEQLERRVGQFFDILIIHLAQGYEAASHRARGTAA